jgi:hypothetical protein
MPQANPGYRGAPQQGGPSEFTRVLGAQRAPSAPAPVPGGPPQKPATAAGEAGKKSPVPLILAGVVLLIVLAAIVVLVLVTRK